MIPRFIHVRQKQQKYGTLWMNMSRQKIILKNETRILNRGNMKQELCFKFLEHLYKYSSGILKKEHIEDVDITYINNEVANFVRRLNPEETATYDKAGVLSKIEKIREETAGDKAVNVSKMILKSRFKLLGALFGGKDDAHVQRFNKISEFNERIKKIIVVLEFGHTF